MKLLIKKVLFESRCISLTSEGEEEKVMIRLMKEQKITNLRIQFVHNKDTGSSDMLVVIPNSIVNELTMLEEKRRRAVARNIANGNKKGEKKP